MCFLLGKGRGFCTQGSLSLPCLLAMKYSLVNFVLLECFSGSSSISLSEASLLSLPLSVSASEMDTLLGSLTCLEDSTPFLLFLLLLLGCSTYIISSLGILLNPIWMSSRI